MSDHGEDHAEQDHWQLLASELGTPPPPPKKARSKEGADAGGESGEASRAAAATRRPDRPSRARPAPPPRPAADWAQLASDLGLSPPPPQEEPSETPSPEPAGEPVASSEPAAEEATFALLEGPAEFVETPVELIGPIAETDEAEPDEEEETAGEEEQGWAPPVPLEGKSEERPSGRRRRRRRRPASDRDEPLFPAPLAEQAASDADEGPDDRTAALAPADDLAPMGAAEGPAGPVAEEAPTGRSKRRRRRRPGRKRDGAEPDAKAIPPADGGQSPGADAPDETGRVAESASDPTAGPAPAADDRADRRERPPRDSRGTKPSHRGVPTWKEAVDLLISANMESRAKRPERPPSSRPRGGRNRGGRGQKRGK